MAGEGFEPPVSEDSKFTACGATRLLKPALTAAHCTCRSLSALPMRGAELHKLSRIVMLVTILQRRTSVLLRHDNYPFSLASDGHREQALDQNAACRRAHILQFSTVEIAETVCAFTKVH